MRSPNFFVSVISLFAFVLCFHYCIKFKIDYLTPQQHFVAEAIKESPCFDGICKLPQK